MWSEPQKTPSPPYHIRRVVTYGKDLSNEKLSKMFNSIFHSTDNDNSLRFDPNLVQTYIQPSQVRKNWSDQQGLVYHEGLYNSLQSGEDLGLLTRMESVCVASSEKGLQGSNAVRFSVRDGELKTESPKKKGLRSA